MQNKIYHWYVSKYIYFLIVTMTISFLNCINNHSKYSKINNEINILK